MIKTLGQAVARSRIFWCVLLLTALVVSRISAGHWYGDFWSHAAAVREITLRPFAPHHPEIGILVASPFLTPYTVAVGWMARLVQIDAITALAVTGLTNLWLLLLGVRRFLLEVDGPSNATFFYALCFALLLWGPDPWVWSGFFHLSALPYVTPYPSTFAAGGLFWLLALHARWLHRRGGPVWLLGPGAGIILLTHPVTAIALGVGIVANTATVPTTRPWKARGLLVIAVGLSAVVLASLWPYYPFWEAVAMRSQYDAENAEMYVAAWTRLWPCVVLGVAAILLWPRPLRRDPVRLMVLLLGALYLIGDLTGRYTLGRLVSLLALLLQLMAARSAALTEQALAISRGRARHFAYLALTLAVLSVAIYGNWASLRSAVTDRTDWTTRYRFLEAHVGQDEVVLVDLVAGHPVPSVAGKVVAHVATMPLVEDAAGRTEDVGRFFSGDGSADQRDEIVRRYGVQWILLEHVHEQTATIRQQFVNRAAVAYTDDTWLLLRANEP